MVMLHATCSCYKQCSYTQSVQVTAAQGEATHLEVNIHRVLLLTFLLFCLAKLHATLLLLHEYTPNMPLWQTLQIAAVNGDTMVQKLGKT